MQSALALTEWLLQWSWTTADVRHSRHTWLPTLEDEFYQLFLSDIPTVLGSLALERYLFRASDPRIGLDSLSWMQRGLLTLSQGVFLFGTFSAGYTAGAILTSPLRRRYREWCVGVVSSRQWQELIWKGNAAGQRII